jgi:UDP-N-acetylmuramoyl-tripeptide--D-alanyl-D-alanine ligase
MVERGRLMWCANLASRVEDDGSYMNSEPLILHERSLGAAAAVLDGRLLGNDVAFSEVSTDTRSLQPGSLFVALQGPNFDGHDFVEQARQAGAVAVLVSRELTTPLPQLLVADTRLALGQLGKAWRNRFDIPLIAVTGSNGKTTVKEMIAAILSTQAATLMTQGNLNNDIGVPLTLLRLNDDHRYAVIEMGANHPGEIAYLCELASPLVSLVNNVNPAHLEGFGDLEGVARAKGEIYEHLRADGIAVINADERFADSWAGSLRGLSRISFAMQHAADVTADPASINSQLVTDEAVRFETRFRVHTPVEDFMVHLPLAGEHNVMNALAAITVTTALGISADAIQQGLAGMQAVQGRLQPRRGKQQRIIIDDTYNANPGSITAALQVLGKCPSPRYLVLGDMGELGTDAASMHFYVGVQAQAAGLDGLYCLGEFSQQAAIAFAEDGKYFTEQTALIDALQEHLPAGATVLVKGSRFMRMERVVQALSAGNDDGEGN